MYYGHDGNIYNSRFDAFGHDTMTPGRERIENDRRLNERLRNSHNQEINQTLNQQLLRQQIDAQRQQNFYNGQHQFGQIFGRQQNVSQNPSTGAPASRQQTNPYVTGFGMPTPERTKTTTSPLAQDAGELKRLLQDYQKGNSAAAGKRVIDFVNQNPMIKAENVDGMTMDDNGLITMTANTGSDQEQVVKQFHQSALSNLNNFAGQQKQTYDPGRKVDDPAKMMKTIQEFVQAEQEMATGNDGDPSKAPTRPVAHTIEQMMRDYGPRAPGYVTGEMQTPGRDAGFNLFGQPEQVTPSGKSWQEVLAESLGGGRHSEAPPPPPGAPVSAEPKNGNTPTVNATPGKPRPWGTWGIHGSYGR